MLRVKTISITAVLLLCAGSIFAAGAGSRASFTRGGWVGAKYVAMGMSAEVTADDVFSIYWNPAGLTELKGRARMSVMDIQAKAKEGKVDEIHEEDLTNFSEGAGEKFFLQIGVSGSMLDVERNAGFAGFAFGLFNGVLGIGVYSIVSGGIEGRDMYGNYTGDLNYVGSVGYISYALNIGGVASLGISTKLLYEKVGNTQYMGAGADIGVQVYVLPFIKIGFVAQDLGSGLYPIENDSLVRKRYNFASPTLRLGLAVITNSGLTLSFSGIKKLEQSALYFGIGVSYEIIRYCTIYLGFNGSQFSTGLTIHVSNVDIAYAFAFDNIKNGYNNIVSLTTLF